MSTGSAVAVEVPDIGDFADVPVIEVLVSEGDSVAADDPLVTLESDKATMDVPAPFAGRVVAVSVSVGDRVSQGSEIVRIEPTEEAPSDTTAAAAVSEGAPTEADAPAALGSAIESEAGDAARENGDGASSASPPQPASAPAPSAPRAAEERPARANGATPYASPAVRRLARELSVDLARVQGSGRKGRITKEDVQRAASGDGGPPAQPSGRGPGGGLTLDLPPWPSIDFAKFGEIERAERSRIQRISAPNLARNWVTIPHVTHNDEADITELEAWRKQLNAERSDVKFTMVSFLIAASVATLKAFPNFNSSLDGDQLVLKRYYNIGFAADTPGGLVVPVIKNADQKGLAQIAGELTELSEKARAGKLAPGDMQGSTFTISSLGGIGGTSFTPIVNAPEVAILGVTRAAMKPVWDGSEFVPRLMVPLSLSYDHRVIDGAAAARFVVHLVQVLSDLRRALL
jgi:pyruvate dehydrogenase E2 component (dihydrolipoamide acetyltransferase)